MKGLRLTRSAGGRDMLTLILTDNDATILIQRVALSPLLGRILGTYSWL